MTDRPDLDAIEARSSAATPGPWYAGAKHVDCGEVWVHTKNPPPVDRDGNPWHEDAEPSVICIGLDDSPEDAAFIAHAREDIPALVAYARRLEEALAEYANADNWRRGEEIGPYPAREALGEATPA